MRAVRYSRSVVIVLLGTILTICDVRADHVRRYAQDSDKPFAEVVADLKIAISEHNYRITGENVIGEALSDRHSAEFPLSSVVHFCNLEHARELLSAAPDFLLHMPCKVAVYEQAGRVRVETWLLPSDSRVGEAVKRVNEILRGIVNDAVR